MADEKTKGDTVLDAEPEKKKGFFQRLFDGLTKTRNSIASGFTSIFNGYSSIDEDFYEDLEEVLIMADIGVETTEELLDHLRETVKEQKIKDPQDCRKILTDGIKERLHVDDTAYDFENRKSVVLVIGVNGVGKTTTVGKLAASLKQSGKSVMIAAADTFRAAAAEQLEIWAERASVPMIRGQEGADPGAVVYDAASSAKAKGTDVLLVDTAGRLHNKKNLMNELHKIEHILEKAYPEAYRETLIVLDGTTGQNALIQAKEFEEVVSGISGIVLTKLDGTAKGGIAIAIQAEMGIPVKYIGVGEGVDDLQKFDADSFVDALFMTDAESEKVCENTDPATSADANTMEETL